MTEDITPDPAAEAEAVAELLAAAKALEARTQHQLNVFQSQGVVFDPGGFVHARMAMLLDFLLGDAEGPAATPARAQYEYAVQVKFAEMIANTAEMVRRERLAAGAVPVRQNGHGGLILPGRG